MIELKLLEYENICEDEKIIESCLLESYEILTEGIEMGKIKDTINKFIEVIKDFFKKYFDKIKSIFTKCNDEKSKFVKTYKKDWDKCISNNELYPHSNKKVTIMKPNSEYFKILDNLEAVVTEYVKTGDTNNKKYESMKKEMVDLKTSMFSAGIKLTLMTKLI